MIRAGRLSGADIMRLLLVGLLSFCAACTSSDIASAPSEDGVKAYRDKDYERAWALLTPLASDGHYRAQRYMAFMLLEGNAPVECIPDNCATEAVKLLLDAANRGDNNAFIVLEAMIASDAEYAPNEAQMIAIERKRAAEGDPMTAWRLIKRYDDKTITMTAEETVSLLKVVSKGDPRVFTYASDAAFRVCQAYISGEGVEENMSTARRWCKKAADQGHNGAVIALSQLNRKR